MTNPPRLGKWRNGAAAVFGWRPWATLVAFLWAVAPGVSRADSEAPEEASPEAVAPVETAESAETTKQADARRGQIAKLYSGYRRSFPNVPQVTVTELLGLPDSANVVVVDVRPAAERGVSMIPGAITAEELEGNPDLYRDRRIVCYCTIGYRSGMYARKLRKQGWSAENLVGSLLAWADQGGALVDGNGATQRMHVYGEKWNLLPPDYEPVW